MYYLAPLAIWHVMTMSAKKERRLVASDAAINENGAAVDPDSTLEVILSRGYRLMGKRK